MHEAANGRIISVLLFRGQSQPGRKHEAAWMKCGSAVVRANEG